MEAVNEPVMLMEMERELAGPDREAHLARYDAVLARLGGRIDAAMEEGVPPEEFHGLEEVREATLLARKILRLTVRVAGEARKA